MKLGNVLPVCFQLWNVTIIISSIARLGLSWNLPAQTHHYYMVCLVKPSHRCFGHRHFSGWKTSSSKEFSNDEIGQRLARVLLAVARDNHHILHHGRLYCRGQRWGSPLQGQGSLCTLLNHQQQQVFVASDLQVRYQNNFFGSRSMKY